MIYRKLKRTWSNGYANYIPRFKETFPELSHLGSEELCKRFRAADMEYYYTEKEPVNFWIRITLPFAIIVWAVMFLSIPIKFMFTGTWGYSLGNKNRVLNWFRALGLS